MFTNFANVWTIVGFSSDLKAEKPLPLEIAGERVVLFRRADGQAVALLDRCPHRGVALSLGRVKDGCIECPFHGWRFDGQGRNCHVPWNPDAKLGNLGAVVVPLREIGGLLWLYTAPGDAPSEPAVPETLLKPGLRVSGTSVMWKTHWTRAMENMLDWPHLPFVHTSTIGRGMVGGSDATMDISWEDRDYGSHTEIRIAGQPQPGGLDYRFPNAMELLIDPPGKTFRLIAVCLPVNEHTTKMILVTIRGFLRARIFDPIFRWMNLRIAREDQAILETSFPSEVPAPSEGKSVRTDGPTLRFRKIYREKIQRSIA